MASDGDHPFGPLTSKHHLELAELLNISNLRYFRYFLENYKTCRTAIEVSAMQEKIILELEADYENSRKGKGVF